MHQILAELHAEIKSEYLEGARTLVDTDPAGTLGLTRALSLSTLGVVVAVLAVIAALDYLWQYRQWYERQKMSLRELKEEFKQTEGDPPSRRRSASCARPAPASA